MKNLKFILPNSPEPLKSGFPAFFLALLFLFGSALWAQSDLSLRGQMLDANSGQPVSNVLITITPGGQQTYSDADGSFRFYYLKPGEITLRVFAYGYQIVENITADIKSDVACQTVIRLKPLEYRDRDQIVIEEKIPQSSVKQIIKPDSPQYESAQNLGDILKYIPGVIVQSSGGGNQASTVSLSGGPAKQTGIFLDGIPLNSQLTGDFDINLIPKQAVEKIEVYENGSGSELGGNALLGAVNIITRKSVLETKFTLDQQVGSFNSNATGMTLQNVLNDKLSSLIIFSRNTASNDFEYSDPKYGNTVRQNNDRDIENVYLNLNYNLKSNDKLSFLYSETSSRAGLPGAVYELTPTASKSEHFRTLNANGEFQINRNLDLRGGVQYNLSHQRFSDTENIYSYDSKYRDSRVNVNWMARLRVHTNHKITARLDLNSNDFRQYNLLSENSAEVTVYENKLAGRLGYEGLFAPHNSILFFDYLNLNISNSASYSSLLEPLYSPSVRVGFEKDMGVRILTNISYCNSYREPTYSSLFWSEDAFSLGNPDLKPEKSEEFEVGLKIILPIPGRLSLGVDYNHSYVRDLIFWHRRFDGKYEPRNLSGAAISALHWHTEWNPFSNTLGIALDYTLSDPRDRSFIANQHDMLLMFYPRKLVDFSIHCEPGNFSLGWKTRHSSQRFIRASNTKSLDSYTVTDIYLGVHQKIAAFNLGVNFKIDNLFSETYEIIERYPLPRRSYSVNLSLTYQPN